MRNPIDFTGKVVIVTGAGTGVGRGIVGRFLEQGAKVVVCDLEEPETLPEVDGNIAAFIAADVRDFEQVNKVVDFTVEKFGRLDVLINNVGGTPFKKAANATPQYTNDVISLNLTATILFCQAANGIMQQQEEGGAIVNIGSVSAVRPSPGTAAYGAAKAGVASLTTSLAQEWAPKVRLNTITCGLIKTEKAHLHYGDDAAIGRICETVPLGRLASPEDIGDTCLYLSSSLSSYVSGSNITVHGGGDRPAYMGAIKNSYR